MLPTTEQRERHAFDTQPTTVMSIVRASTVLTLPVQGNYGFHSLINSDKKISIVHQNACLVCLAYLCHIMDNTKLVYSPLIAVTFGTLQHRRYIWYTTA